MDLHTLFNTSTSISVKKYWCQFLHNLYNCVNEVARHLYRMCRHNSAQPISLNVIFFKLIFWSATLVMYLSFNPVGNNLTWPTNSIICTCVCRWVKKFFSIHWSDLNVEIMLFDLRITDCLQNIEQIPINPYGQMFLLRQWYLSEVPQQHTPPTELSSCNSHA